MASTLSEDTRTHNTAILAETCNKTQLPETQILLLERHPTPSTHHAASANLTVAVKETEDLTRRCTCAGKLSSTLQCVTFPRDFTQICHFILPSKTSSKSFPHCHGLIDHIWPLANFANMKATPHEQRSTLRLPKSNENPSLRIREQLSGKML